MSSLKPLSNKEEIDHYEAALASFLSQELDAERFTGMRLQLGVYGQRQDGVNMVRIKLPGGRLDPVRLSAIADVAETYAPKQTVHITTRQDLQLHHVPLEKTAQVLRHLSSAGVTTREACGNTIRNITTCPLAGVCPRERVDVTRHLDGTVAHFLRNPLNQQMPRKFKISFSGCESDCAQGLIQDLAFIATRHNDKTGFKVLAAGGLGHKPHKAITLVDFIEEADMLAATEAVITLHNKYSDRTKRAKSRVKFLVDRFGAEGFVERFNEEFVRTRAALAGKPVPRGEWREPGDGPVPGAGAPRGVFVQRQADLRVIPIAAPLGQLTAVQLRAIAALLLEHDLDDARTTQDQNLILVNVPAGKVTALIARLNELGLKSPEPGDDVVACPGASTCRLGITTSMHAAPKLSGGQHDLRIRVSGCQNGCAQPESGDIGIYGEGKRVQGKLIPHYQMYLGGNGRSAGGAIAIKGPSIPAQRIEQAMSRIQKTFAQERNDGESFFNWVHRQAPERFQSLLADLTQVSRFELNKMARDHGVEAEFRVLSLGGGECASDTGVAIGRAFLGAAHERSYREAFVFQRKYEDAIACAEAQIKLLGNGLTDFLAKKKTGEFTEISAVLRELTFSQTLGEQLDTIALELGRLTEATEAEIKQVFAAIDLWILDAATLCKSRDLQLDLRDALPPIPASARKETLATA